MGNNFCLQMCVKLYFFQRSCLYMAVFWIDYQFDNPLHIKCTGKLMLKQGSIFVKIQA